MSIRLARHGLKHIRRIELTQLTEDEKAFAREAGKARQESARLLNQKDRLIARMTDEEKLQNEIFSIMSELYTAKLFKLPWVAGKYDQKLLTDVGSDIEVKTSKYKNAHLLVRPRKFSKYPLEHVQTHRFVLIIHDPVTEELTFAGWMHGTEIMQDKYWRRDSWWVPQQDLYKEIAHDS